jgi:hypothetical protein
MKALFLALLVAGPQDGEKALGDLEDPAGLQSWSNLELPGVKEPAVTLELTADGARSGRHALKITFAGGTWPTVACSRVPEDLTAFKTLLADVTVGRPCVVGFTFFQEKSQRGDGWAPVVSRWSSTQFLKPGLNSFRAGLEDPSGNGYMLNKAKYGRVTALEIFMYAPHGGESILVENLRLGVTRESVPPVSRQFTVLGTPWVVSGVTELGKKLKDPWTPPVPRTVDEVEAAFKAEFETLKKAHPRAVLGVFRDGEPGPGGAAYSGWRDAHLESHGPDTNTFWRAKQYGREATGEAFMRHRSLLLQADLSAIPAGAEILAARFILVRASKPDPEKDPLRTPTLWVAEACNRPWEEAEANGYQYAKDQFWKSVGGMSPVSYAGDDPDFLPLYLAYGPGQGKVNVWDFTEAVKFWTDGRHQNHGFMLHGDGRDYMMAHCRESADQRSRPAILVAYEPK